ncbi:MAG: PIN domain-containing protein [Bacteroidota bacterium]
MDIIIDANIFRRDLKLNDKGFEILIDYLAKTNSKLIFPSIVLEEIKGLYKRVLQERLEEYTKSLEKLKSTLLFIQMPENPVLDIEGDSNRYIDFLHKKFKTSAKNIIPYKNEYLPELVHRAIQRKKPLDSKGQQFRDGILWLTLLDYAESTDEKNIAFISDNTSDFSEKGENKLSKELNDESKSRGIEIKYFKTLNDFAKEHASVIDFINKDWIEKNIDNSILEKLFIGILGDSIENDILSNLDLDKNEKATGNIERTKDISSRLIDYFVYEKKDGTILLNIEIEYEIEYEIEIERNIEHENPRYEYVYITNPSSGEPEMDMVYIPDFDIEQEYVYQYECPSFVGKFVISIKDKKIDKYEIKEWNWG